MGSNRKAATAVVGAYQTDLFASGAPAIDTAAEVERCVLDGRSWIDVSTRWLSGGDQLLLQLAADLRWSTARRPMYGQMVDEPRLGAHLRPGTDRSTPTVDGMAFALSRRYGQRLNSVWVNYYRDGRDSVAWHSDRIGIDPADSLVAIVTLGGPRRFLLRPKGGGASRSFTFYSGDLAVMGGACQQTWEHSVPKAAAAPPRMSVTFRRTAGKRRS